MKSKHLVVLTATALCCMATATHAAPKPPSTTVVGDMSMCTEAHF